MEPDTLVSWTKDPLTVPKMDETGLRQVHTLPTNPLYKEITGSHCKTHDIQRCYTSSKFKWDGNGSCFMPAQRRHEPNRALTLGRARERTHAQMEGDVDG